MRIFAFIHEWLTYSAKGRARDAAKPYTRPDPTYRCPRCKSSYVQMEYGGSFACYDCGRSFAEAEAKTPPEEKNP